MNAVRVEVVLSTVFRSIPWRMACSILVVSSLAYAQWGFFLRFELQRTSIQRSIKDRIRKGIPKEELTPFVMSAEEWQSLNWIKPKREFRLPSGDMYDVVYVNVQDGEVKALCVHDKDETVLFAGLDMFVKGLLDGPDHSSGTRVRVAQFLAQLDLPMEGNQLLALNGLPWYMPGGEPELHAGTLSVPVPPPRS